MIKLDRQTTRDWKERNYAKYESSNKLTTFRCLALSSLETLAFWFMVKIERRKEKEKWKRCCYIILSPLPPSENRWIRLAAPWNRIRLLTEKWPTNVCFFNWLLLSFFSFSCNKNNIYLIFPILSVLGGMRVEWW